MNKAIIIGNLSRDPELRTTAAGKNVCNFTVAVNRRTAKDAPQTCDFIPCVCFDNMAMVVHTYLKKGKKCAVTGKIQTRTYDAQDGSKRWATEIIADEVEFLSAAEPNEGKPAEAPQPAQPFDIDDGDLPF